jgi:hypothetical protein
MPLHGRAGQAPPTPERHTRKHTPRFTGAWNPQFHAADAISRRVELTQATAICEWVDPISASAHQHRKNLCYVYE